MVPENDRKDDPAEIPRRARTPRHDSVRMRMHMRHETEIGAIACIHEQGRAGHEAEHCALVVGIGKPDSDKESTCDEREHVDEDLLAPDIGVAVDHV